MGFPFKTIIWRQTQIPVIIGNERIFLKITLKYTCSLLTPDILHTDVTPLAITRRKALYKAHFLDELESLCSVDQGHSLIDETGQITVRIRRELEKHNFKYTNIRGRPRKFIFATIIVVSAGLWIASGVSFALSVAYRVTFESMKDVADTQGKQMEILEERINVTQIAVQSLQKDFNSLVTDFESHKGGFLELKQKSIGTAFVISYITSKFVLVRQIIRETIRKWNNGNLNPDFLDYLSLTMPCGKNAKI